MELPAASWVNLALQIPLALVIVVLTIYFLRHLQQTNKDMLEFMSKQADINREFMRFQQELHNAGLGRLAEEIKGDKLDMVKEVSALTQRVDSIIEKAIMIERLLPDRRGDPRP